MTTTVDELTMMVLADVNGDGKADIVAAGSQSEEAWSLSVLLNKGGGDFATAVDQPLGPNLQGLALADLNGDGKLDVVVTCASGYEATLFVFLGRGDGTFPTKLAYDAGPYPGALALADLDGDRKLDIVVAERDIMVLLGRGDGSFVQGGSYPAGGTVGSVAIGDVTGDGALDIVVGNSAAMNLLPGRGDGSFEAPAAYSVAYAAPVLADMNRDGKLDIVALIRSSVVVLPSSCLGCQSSGICGPAPILNLPRK
jgi:large repetitive protein